MSNNNNESRELTAAELDLVAGGAVDIFLDLEGVKAPRKEVSGYSWGVSQTGYTYDIRQNKSV